MSRLEEIEFAAANISSSGAICLPMITILSHSPGRASAAEPFISLAISTKRSRLPQTKKISSSLSFRSRRCGARFIASCTSSAAWSYRP